MARFLKRLTSLISFIMCIVFGLVIVYKAFADEGENLMVKASEIPKDGYQGKIYQYDSDYKQEKTRHLEVGDEIKYSDIDKYSSIILDKYTRNIWESLNKEENKDKKLKIIANGDKSKRSEDFNKDFGEKYLVSRLGIEKYQNRHGYEIIQKAWWKYEKNMRNMGEDINLQQDYDNYEINILFDKAKTLNSFFRNKPNDEIFVPKIDWETGVKNGVDFDNVTVTYDDTDKNNPFYLVGPYSVKWTDYDRKNNYQVQQMRQFVLYTDKNPEGLVLHMEESDNVQDTFTLVRASKDDGKKLQVGYDANYQTLPQSGDIFYIKLKDNKSDPVTKIKNFKVVVRAERPAVNAKFFEIEGVDDHKNYGRILYVEDSCVNYIEKENFKYVNLNMGVISIDSKLKSDGYEINNSNAVVKYKLKVKGAKQLQSDGKVKKVDYTEEEIDVPINGSTTSRVYVWEGSDKPSYTLKVEKPSKEGEPLDDFIEFDSMTMTNLVLNNGQPGRTETYDLNANSEITGNLEDGEINFQANYNIKYGGDYTSAESELNHGYICVDNIVKKDDSLENSIYSISGKDVVQAYILTITPGNGGMFTYGSEVYKNRAFKKLIVVSGREEDENIVYGERDSSGGDYKYYYYEGNVDNGYHVPNRYVTDKIIWPKNDEPPTYTVERLEIGDVNDLDGNNFIQNSPYIGAAMYNDIDTGDFENIGNEGESIQMRNILKGLPKNTYAAIPNSQETIGDTGIIVKVGEGEEEKYYTVAKMVSNHRKESGKIKIEKILEEDDILIKKGEEKEKIFDLLKDHLKFEYEITIGTDTEKVILDKNSRESYDYPYGGLGYKWIWESANEEWLFGNRLSYTIKENLSNESTLFSGIAIGIDDKKDGYTIHGNVATGTFKEFNERGNDDPIRFYSKIVYEKGTFSISENLISPNTDDSGKNNYDVSSPLVGNHGSKVRRLLKNKNIYFNIEVDGLYSYKNSNIDTGFGDDEKHYKIIDGGIFDYAAPNGDEDDVRYSINMNNLDLNNPGNTSNYVDGEVIGEFCWVKGIPPKYIVEQDIEKIKKQSKDLVNILCNQTIGCKEGYLEAPNANSKFNNIADSMKFEFTNYIRDPIIDQQNTDEVNEEELLEGRIFLKQYVYGLENYLKEDQKGFEFTFDIEVTATRKTDKDVSDLEKGNVNLLKIEDLHIKSQVADDGNYVWEWTSPDIYWNPKYYETPNYVITLDKSKLPVGMKLDFSEGLAESDRSVKKDNKVSGELHEIDTNESTKSNDKEHSGIDERNQSTDVFFYASYGSGNKGKIKVIQRADTEKASSLATEGKENIIYIAVKGDFTYDNETYRGDKTYYLKQNKSLSDNIKDCEIMLDLRDDFIEVFESNYFSWSGNAPKVWVVYDESTLKSTSRSITPVQCVKKGENAVESALDTIDSPTGVFTIVDTYYENGKCNQKTSFSIEVSPDEIVSGIRNKEKIPLYFKVDIYGIESSIVRANWNENENRWVYNSQDIKICGREKISIKYMASDKNIGITTNGEWSREKNGAKTAQKTTNTLANTRDNRNDIYGCRYMLEGDAKDTYKFNVKYKNTESHNKAKIHIVAIKDRSTESKKIHIKAGVETNDYDGILSSSNPANGIKKVKDRDDICTIEMDPNQTSSEIYTDSFSWQDNGITKFEIRSFIEPNNDEAQYWNTNIGQLNECDNDEIINVILDFTENGMKYKNFTRSKVYVQNKITDLNGISEEEFFIQENIGINQFTYNLYVEGYGCKKISAIYGKNSYDNFRKYVQLNYIVPISAKEGENSFYYNDSFNISKDGILSCKVTPFERPLYYKYNNEGMGQDNGYNLFTNTSNVKEEESEYELIFETKVDYERDILPFSKTIIIDNKFTDDNILKKEITYKIAIKGTYEYIDNFGNYFSVVNGEKAFYAKTRGTQKIAINNVKEPENATDVSKRPIYFNWKEDASAPTYSVTIVGFENDGKNLRFSNNAGRLKNVMENIISVRNELYTKTVNINLKEALSDSLGNNRYNYASVKIYKREKSNAPYEYANFNVAQDFEGWSSNNIVYNPGEELEYIVIPFDYNGDAFEVTSVSSGNNKKSFYNDNGKLKNANEVIHYNVNISSTTINIRDSRILKEDIASSDKSIKKNSSGQVIYNPEHHKKFTFVFNTDVSVSGSDTKIDFNNNQLRNDNKSVKINYLKGDTPNVSVEVENQKLYHWDCINLSSNGSALVGTTKNMYASSVYVQSTDIKQVDLTSEMSGELTIDGNKPTNIKDTKEIEVFIEDEYGNLVDYKDKFGKQTSCPIKLNSKGKWNVYGIPTRDLYAHNYKMYYVYDGQKYEEKDSVHFEPNGTKGYVKEVLNSSTGGKGIIENRNILSEDNGNLEEDVRGEYNKRFAVISKSKIINAMKESFVSVCNSDKSSVEHMKYNEEMLNGGNYYSVLEAYNNGKINNKLSMMASTRYMTHPYSKSTNSKIILSKDNGEYKADLNMKNYNLNSTSYDNLVFKSVYYMKHINLNLSTRTDVEVETLNEFNGATIRMNDKAYTVNKDLIKLDKTDYYYRDEVYRQNDKFASYEKDNKSLMQEMSIELSYKYTIKNKSNYVLGVNEIENYVTKSLSINEISNSVSYEIVPNYKSNENIDLNKIVISFTGSNGLLIKPKETAQIDVVFSVNKDTIDGIKDTLDIAERFENIFEISSYSTYKCDDKGEPIKDNNKLVYAGKMSNNFSPGNLNLNVLDGEKLLKEKDTAICKNITIKLEESGDKKSGHVYETDGKGKKASVGGMTVQQLERMNGKNAGYDFLWSTDTLLDVYGGNTFSDLTGYSSTVETSREKNGTKEIGQYIFSNMPNKGMVINVLYGIDKGILDSTIGTTGDPVALDENGAFYAKRITGGTVLTANFEGDEYTATPAVYNGQDFKSAIDPDGKYGDDEAMRLRAMSNAFTFINENTKVFNQSNYRSAIHQKIFDDYNMTIRGNQVRTRGDNEGDYSDICIIERPENKIYLDQEIKSIKLTSNSGQVILDAEYDIQYNRENLNSSNKGKTVKIINDKEGIVAHVTPVNDKSINIDQIQQLYKEEFKTTNGKNVKIDGWKNYKYGTGIQNFKYINIDFDILQGTSVEINYEITAFNIGDEDYVPEWIDDLFKDLKAKDYGNKVIKYRDIMPKIEQLKTNDIAEKRKHEGKIEFGDNDNGVGKYYYTGVIDDKARIVKTRVRQIASFIDNDLSFDLSKNNEKNQFWKTTSAIELNGNGVDARRLIEKDLIKVDSIEDKNEISYVEKDRSNLILSVDDLDDGHVSNSEFEACTVPYEIDKDNYKSKMNLVVTKVLAAADFEDMSYDTFTEFVKYENTAGRRDDAIYIGNTDPSLEIFEEATKERDSSASEIITFMPPTGIMQKEKERKRALIVCITSIISEVVAAYILKTGHVDKLFNEDDTKF